MTANEQYFLSLILTILGSIGFGFGLGQLRGYVRGWDAGFNSCSAIWKSLTETGDDDHDDSSILDSTEVN